VKEVVVHWFRRDLRLHDNRALYEALTSGTGVLPVFIFDTKILDDLSEKTDRRVSMLVDMVQQLDEGLQQHGSSLKVCIGTPIRVFEDLAKEYVLKAVYVNEDYEPYAIRRDAQVEEFLRSLGSRMISFKDQVVFAKDEVLKDDGSPYTVFTPYMKKWRARLDEQMEALRSFPSEDKLGHLIKESPEDPVRVEDLGFEAIPYLRPEPQLDDLFLAGYKESRDLPYLDGVSRLSIELRFGTISVRTVYKKGLDHYTFTNELIWREFYMMILYYFPNVISSSFKPAYDRIEWNDNDLFFEAWKEGKTGIAFVDAGMRQLNKTGWMHNRLRMITASFLTKNLGIDWRVGEAYFAQKLLDFELSSNNGGWQWAAGTGCDAAPYFRVFNPESQQKRFDPDLKFTRKWVPEFQELNYRAIVDLKKSREEALIRYKTALQS
jgi:deoxyribodipyrimidine photo-lyase